jgi:hypothetical protein
MSVYNSVMTAEKTKPMSMISVRIPEDLKSQLDEIAEHEGKYTSEILTELIAARVEMKSAGINVRSTQNSMTVERLLDELIQYRQRRAEIQNITEKKSWLFGGTPEYLQDAKKYCDQKLIDIDSKLQDLFRRQQRVICPKCGTDKTEEDDSEFEKRGRRINNCGECGTRLQRQEGKTTKGRSKNRLEEDL